MTTDHDARQHAAAMTTIDQLINDLPTTVYAAAAEQVRGQRADLRLVRSMLLRGRVASTTLDQLAPLCGCNAGPDTDGPEQDCPIHGDGQSFVALCRWRDQVVAAAHTVRETSGRGPADNVEVDDDAFERLDDLLDAGPWGSAVNAAGERISAGQAGPAPVDPGQAGWLAEHGEPTF